MQAESKLASAIKSVPYEVRRNIAAALIEVEMQMLRKHSGQALVTERRYHDGYAKAYLTLAEMFWQAASKEQLEIAISTNEI